MLRVTPRGHASWSFVYRSPTTGRHTRKTLGTWPSQRLEEARAAAYELKAAVEQGRDPAREQREAAAATRARQTFGEVAKRYVELVARPTIDSWRNVDAALRNHLLPAWGDRPIVEIRRAEVHALLDSIVAAGRPGAAREVRKHASRIFGWAYDRELIATNPAYKLLRDELKKRRPVHQLDDEELRAVWLAAGLLGYPWEQAWRLLILTGARRNEIARARWSEIDRETRTLRLPADRHKSRRGLAIPLSSLAWEVLRGCPHFVGADPYILSCTHGRGPVVGFAKAKKRLDEAVSDLLDRQIAPYRTHDLRVTFRSRLARLRVPREVAEACLGHAQPALERVYDAHDYEAEMRGAMERYAHHVVDVLGEHSAAEEVG